MPHIDGIRQGQGQRFAFGEFRTWGKCVVVVAVKARKAEVQVPFQSCRLKYLSVRWIAFFYRGQVFAYEAPGAELSGVA